MPKNLPAFRARDALLVQQEVRRLLGLEEEVFSVPAFIGMVSDEIEHLRADGWSDDSVAELIRRVTGQEITPEDVTQNYASPQARASLGLVDDLD